MNQHRSVPGPVCFTGVHSYAPATLLNKKRSAVNKKYFSNNCNLI